MLTIERLTHSYTPGQPLALDGLSFTVAPGELVALLGPSGAGKSTLIRCINGLVRPDSGRVVVGGVDVTAQTGAGLQAVRRQVAVVFQEFHLIDRLTVETNVLSGRLGRYPFWRAALGLWAAQDRRGARRLLDRVGLAEHAAKLARELSGGQRQRVAIARAMMQEPKLLLGDEPVASLDPVTARSVLQLLSDLTKERGLTTLLSLHDVALAKEVCRRAVGIRAGRVVYDGPVAGVTPAVMAQIYGGEPGVANRPPQPGPRTATEVALEKGCKRT